jgi:putative redox protein
LNLEGLKRGIMKLQCKWNEKMKFTAEADGHQVSMDAKSPIGGDSAMTPKHLLLAGISGCTAMDVVALLKKYKQPFESLDVDADAELTEGVFPAVFKEVKLIFRLKGAVDPARILEAVKLSQTKYCGVTAMVSKSVPVTYSVELNGESIGSGKADFG